MQHAQLGIGFIGVFERVMRMHPGGAMQHLRMRLGQRQRLLRALAAGAGNDHLRDARSEEHTSELQSLMRISYAVFCLKKKKTKTSIITPTTNHSRYTTNTNTTITP